MIAISNTSGRRRAATHRAAGEFSWRDVGLGLAASLFGLAMTVAGTRGESGPDIMAWQAMEVAWPVSGWKQSVPTELLPLGVLPPETSR